MYVSDPMTDDQPLMRYFTHDKLVRMLDPRPALEVWKFLDPPVNGTLIFQAPTPPEYGALWMSLPHKFQDQDEGTFPALNADDNAYCDAMASHLKLDPEEAKRKKQEFLSRDPEGFRAVVRSRAQICGVSCWYQDSVESEQMWKEYVPDGRGVIVKTTLGRFEAALGYVTPVVYKRTSRPLFATINYIDRDQFFAAQDGYYHLLALKGEGYQHEREVRLIAQSPSLVKATSNHGSPSLDKVRDLVQSKPAGFNILLNLERLIEEVRVYPSASDDYLEEVRDLLSGKGLPKELVQQSALPWS